MWLNIPRSPRLQKTKLCASWLLGLLAASPGKVKLVLGLDRSRARAKTVGSEGRPPLAIPLRVVL